MKIDRPLSSVAPINSQERRPLPTADVAALPVRRAESERQVPERWTQRSASYNIQLNRQLSAMQLADRYVSELEARLSRLKLSLGNRLSSTSPEARETLKEDLRQVQELLEQRAQRSGAALDPSFKLSLNEPVRARFKFQGLDSIGAIKASGRETLVFKAGRGYSEPVAVLLDDEMSDQQLLTRFNAGLGQLGIRAELNNSGELVFSAREQEWQALKEQLAVRGEGKLFPKEQFTPVQSQTEVLLRLPQESELEAKHELRRILDAVIAALDKLAALREQLAERQQEIREFLSRYANQDEKVWAESYAAKAADLMTRQPPDYAAITQTVLAQTNINRYTVVSLLS